MTIHPGKATNSKTREARRERTARCSLQPARARPEAAISPPTSTSAPATCTSRGKLMLSGRMAANISGSRLEDHVEQDQRHADDGDQLQAQRLGRGQRG